jgi:hypothetical protein
VFKKPVVCLLSKQVMEDMEAESRLPQPFIQFKNEKDLCEHCLLMVNPKTGGKIRGGFGLMAYRYAKKMHDVKPCAERFMRILELK